MEEKKKGFRWDWVAIGSLVIWILQFVFQIGSIFATQQVDDKLNSMNREFKTYSDDHDDKLRQEFIHQIELLRTDIKDIKKQ